MTLFFQQIYMKLAFYSTLVKNFLQIGEFILPLNSVRILFIFNTVFIGFVVQEKLGYQLEVKNMKELKSNMETKCSTNSKNKLQHVLSNV